MKLFYVFDDIEQFIEINKGQSTIGRSSAATFTIRHDTISKVHTLLNYENGKWPGTRSAADRIKKTCRQGCGGAWRRGVASSLTCRAS